MLDNELQQIKLAILRVGYSTILAEYALIIDCTEIPCFRFVRRASDRETRNQALRS